MSATPIADMVERLLTDGVSHETVVFIVRSVELALARSRRPIEPRSEPTFVYCLADHGGEIFYVGISSDPEQRFRRHRNDELSAAYDRIQEVIEQHGREPLLNVIKRFDNRQSAEEFERRLIVSIPNLVNRQRLQAKPFPDWRAML
jgi:predicted GIY-YIG superfamily endonuclease